MRKENGRSRPLRVEVSQAASEPKRLDSWLQRLANTSQPALLALGVFGYFYTVVPVFQNQQLQEQAAKLELEKGAAERQLASLVAQQSKVKQDIAQLQADWSRERARNTRLADDVAAAKERELLARRQGIEAQAKLQSELSGLEAARWELVLLDLSSAYYFPRLNAALSDYSAESEKVPGGFILAAGKKWPDSFTDLLAAVDVAASKSKGRSEIPQSYYSELRELIAASESALRCSRPGLEGIYEQYLRS
jgi:hypothetical protein